MAFHLSSTKKSSRHCKPAEPSCTVGVVSLTSRPRMKSAAASPVIVPLKLKLPRGLLAAKRVVYTREMSKPAIMLCAP